MKGRGEEGRKKRRPNVLRKRLASAQPHSRLAVAMGAVCWARHSRMLAGCLVTAAAPSLSASAISLTRCAEQRHSSLSSFAAHTLDWRAALPSAPSPLPGAVRHAECQQLVFGEVARRAASALASAGRHAPSSFFGPSRRASVGTAPLVVLCWVAHPLCEGRGRQEENCLKRRPRSFAWYVHDPRAGLRLVLFLFLSFFVF